MKLRIAAPLVLATLLGCTAAAPPPAPAMPDPDEPAAEADPASAPPGQDQTEYDKLDEAGQACAVLQYLQCPEASGSCRSDVRTLVILGTFKQTNLACIRKSRTKVRVRKCQVDC